MGFTVVGVAVFDGSEQAAFEWNGVVDVEAVDGEFAVDLVGDFRAFFENCDPMFGAGFDFSETPGEVEVVLSACTVQAWWPGFAVDDEHVIAFPPFAFPTGFAVDV